MTPDVPSGNWIIIHQWKIQEGMKLTKQQLISPASRAHSGSNPHWQWDLGQVTDPSEAPFPLLIYKIKVTARIPSTTWHVHVISMCTLALPQAQLVKKKRVITTVLSKTHLLEWLGYEGWYKGQNSGLRGTSNTKVDRPKTWRIHNTLDVGKGIRWNEKELNFFSVRGEEMVKSTLRLIHTGFFYWNGQRKSGYVRTLSSFSFSYIIHHNDAF